MPSLRPFSRLCAFALCLACAGASADVCFTVLDRSGQVMHQSRRAPVDMARPIGETLYSRFPGASVMVFGTNNDACEEKRATASVAAAQPRRAVRRM